MTTVPALKAALNNVNAQLTVRDAQLANLETQLKNLKTRLNNQSGHLIQAAQDLYAPMILPGLYVSLNPGSFSGETQIVRHVPAEQWIPAHYEELWSSLWPRGALGDVQYNMYGQHGTRLPGLFVDNVAVDRWVIVCHTVGEKRTWVTFD